ncbi:acyltransferase family protein [Lysobacter sp. cf310]|uniref:acyltransferase family protein n=1 Tax=Lysobacter sp. cf310 TaxID=1761790 RepID=UPI0008E8D427|nr:heparan-alpha-glucosaminide N-acetyltransferase domain-containing protein [Lysobacter sp. cf310]SFL26725.1 Predicted acyltransferase [Lysobacter sp. cf310]
MGASATSAAAPRYASVDALRGLTVAAMLLVNNPGDWNHVYAPLLHAHWHGCTPTDLIFPMFLFIVGVSIALALNPRVERGDARPALARGVFARAARIFGLGLLLHVCAWWAFDLEHYRVMGVLQRIGLCFGAAGLCALWLPARAQWALLAALLLGYGLLLAAGGSYEPYANIASRFDSQLLGVHVYQLEPGSGRGHDPEGLLSTLGALATALLGLRAGDWLRRGRVPALWIAGAVCMALGYALSYAQPFNKNLWTPSYVLWTGGIACWILAVFHRAIDQRGWPPLGRAFGVNAIAAYAGSAFLLYALAAAGWLEPLYRHAFADWMTPRFGPTLPSLAYALVFVALWWVVVRALDTRRIYFKI